MDDNEVLVNFDASLPAADFQIESSDEDSTDGPQLVVFNRSDHLKTYGIEISYDDLPDYNKEDTFIKDDCNHTNITDVVIEDIEDKSVFEDTTMTSLVDATTSTEDEWLDFRSTFESLAKQSEVEIHQQRTQDTIERLKDDLIVNMLAASGFNPTTHSDDSSLEGEPSDSVDKNNSTKITATVKRNVRINKGLVLQSNRFDSLSERDLDTVLEAIEEEESRDSSLSPVTDTNGRVETGFKWERVYDEKEGTRVRDSVIMDQLVAMCEQDMVTNNEQDMVTNDEQDMVTDNDNVVVMKNGKESTDHYQQGHEDIQWICSKTSSANHDTAYLDLRAAQTEVYSKDESSETAKHLLQMKLSSSTKSSSEDSDDPYSWKEQRKTVKESFANTTNELKEPADKNNKAIKTTDSSNSNGVKESVTVAVAVSSFSKGATRTKERKHNQSSGSFSEDDLFVSSFNEGKSASNTSDNSPSLLQKKGKSSKKKKRKGKGRKDSVSGSDGEGNGSNNNTNKKNNKKQKNGTAGQKKESVNKTNHTTGPVAVPNTGSKKSPRRLRHDSWPMSSDEDTVSPRRPLVPLSYSYSSDGEPFSRDTEKVKHYLQMRIESRKPPYLFNTPLTPPLFHQDISFTPPFSSINPSCTLTHLLVLRLTDSGMLPPTDVSVSHEALKVLQILLTVWLITLYTNDESGRPVGASGAVSFKIGGLLQSVVDGSPCIIAGLINNETTDDLNSILQSLCLSHILNPLLKLPKLMKHISQGGIEQSLRIMSTLPLSTFLSIQTDTLPLLTPLSFYWSSLYDMKCLRSDISLHCTSPLQVTVCNLEQACLFDCELLFTLLYQATRSGLDVAGIRLAFDSSSSVFIEPDQDRNCVLTFAVAFRGTSAIQCLQDIVGPEDSVLAKLTDPNSISATFGKEGNKKSSVTCVHSHFWAGLELAKWFGGRACPDTIAILGVSDAITRSERRKRQRVRFSESESEDCLTPLSLPDDIAFPPLVSNISALTVCNYSKIILVASPLVVPLHYGTLFRSINSNGFDIIGIKRVRLNAKRASILKIPPTASHFFTPSSAPTSPDLNLSMLPLMATNCIEADTNPVHPPLPSVVLILGKECALSHSLLLIRNAFCDIKAAYENDSAPSNDNDSTSFNDNGSSAPYNENDPASSNVNDPTSSNENDHASSNENDPASSDENDSATSDELCAFFHATEFSEECMKVLGSFVFTPMHKSTEKVCNPQLQDEPTKEEVCVLSVIGNYSMNKSIDLLNSILTKPKNVEGNNSILGSIELLGIKVIPELSRFHAKQIPSSVTGTLLYQDAVDYITGKVASLFLFRGLNVNDRVTQIIKTNQTRITSSILRPSSEAFEIFSTSNISCGFEIASCFFIDKELFCDSRSWTLKGFVPPSWFNDCAVLSSLLNKPAVLLSVFTVPTNNLRLLVRVVDKLFRTGFSIVGMRLVKCQNENEDVLISDTVEEYRVVVCVQRYNAVWQLSHELIPFISSSTDLKFSRSFTDAIKDVQNNFSHGVHTLEESVQTYYQVPSAPIDSHSSQLIPLIPSLTDSPLSEATCIIIQPSVFTLSSCTTVLDILNKAVYLLRGLIMTELSKTTAECVCDIMDYRKEQSEEFVDGTCLIVLVTRDNGATCYESIITSAINHSSRIREETSSVKSLLIKKVLHTTTCHQTNALKQLFFTSPTNDIMLNV